MTGCPFLHISATTQNASIGPNNKEIDNLHGNNNNNMGCNHLVASTVRLLKI